MQPFKYTPNLNSGQLRHKIRFQKLEGVEDELGQYRESWVDGESAWCMIKTMQGREYFAAAASQSENTYRFVIRYRPGIDSSMRVIYNGRTFNIESAINDDEMNKTLTLIAKEKGVSND
ncbi:head-tail adaptor protein [Rossellomorea vietnamensis]|uniref:Head-tail adaptor protein n=1 Tax=Rossellomorea vietnamensis TaxID=218284 RepID=A0A5D4KE03_9BACI|nr:phage head closure protein [Rossellomorea vietnamensis]TYR75581.1 head-tail adaptor protein [Rossellomorea vietnamensis]